MDQFGNQPAAENISPTARWAPGQIIQGRYRVVRELGRGGMGVVLEVENILIKKRCALKLIEIASATPLAVRRLQREAKV